MMLRMKLLRQALVFLCPIVLALFPRAMGQEFRIEPLAEAAPGEVSEAVRGDLSERGFRVLDTEGKPLLDLWPRKAIPAKAAPSAPSGGAVFPFLAEGELMGAVRYHREGGDYRDQPIVAGVYTLRYLLHPVNGDHQGVAPFRDFFLLLPAGVDTTNAILEREPVEKESAEVAGSNHPAVLRVDKAKEGSKLPGVVRDETLDHWGVTIPMSLQVAGEATARPFPVLLIVEGAAPL